MIERTSTRKYHFLVRGWAFSLDREPSNGWQCRLVGCDDIDVFLEDA
jgi:hypothetical protein